MFNNPSNSGSVVQGEAGGNFAPPTPGTVPTGTPVTLSTQHIANPVAKKNNSLILTLIILILAIVSVVFIFLYISKYLEFVTLKTDADNQKKAEIALAIADNKQKLEEEFVEREKHPYRTFAGPVDYGSLSFEYPQTWSVYIAKDASKGGDYEAYLNPAQVDPVGQNTINALRVIIRDRLYDTVIDNYRRNVSMGTLQYSTRQVGGMLADIYSGTLPSSSIVGAACIFKLRDKTVILQTDAELFLDEFFKLLDTVSFVR